MVAERSKIDHDRLRFEFVDMLFALAIAEVATHISELLLSKGGSPLAAPSAWFDLGLAFLLIVMSWIGWSNSAGMRGLPAATDVFSWPFVVLVIDVVLVVMYYILVKGVEMPDRGGMVFPSAKNEARCIAAVFLLYVCWDFITKGLISDRSGGKPRSLEAFERFFSGNGAEHSDESAANALRRFWPRGKVSLACFGLACVILLLCESGRAGNGAASVMCIDTALLAVVLWFRAKKAKSEHPKWCIASLLLFVGATGASWY